MDLPSRAMKLPAMPEVDKRDHGAQQEMLVQSLLEEEQATKKQKRGPEEGDGARLAAAAAAAAAAAGKGNKKTLKQIEDEEGGPVKESLIGMAHTRRAQDRKKPAAAAGDADFKLDETEKFEEALEAEAEEEAGMQLEPFNLKQEREDGYFDADGSYVERKSKDEDGAEKDAWFESDDTKVVSEQVRKRIQEQRKKVEEAEKQRRAPLTDRQIAQRKADLAALMQPGETVTRALKRLGGGGAAGGGSTGGGRAMGKRERARLQAAAAAAATAGSEPTSTAAAQQQQPEDFEKLAELADELLAEGEMEVYGETKEGLLRAARMWLPNLQAQQLAAGAAPAAAQPTAVASTAATLAAGGGDDDDDDMFGDAGAGPKTGGPPATAAAAAPVAGDGDDDMFGDGAAPAGSAAQPAGQAAAAATAVTPQPPAEASTSAASADGDGVEYASWPIKELKRLLQERGVDPSACVEKADLVAKVREVLASGAASGPGGAHGADAGAFTAPPGYAFDPSSGFFYSSDAGMYFDSASGLYGQPASGRWYSYDAASRQFAEVPR